MSAWAFRPAYKHYSGVFAVKSRSSSQYIRALRGKQRTARGLMEPWFSHTLDFNRPPVDSTSIIIFLLQIKDGVIDDKSWDAVQHVFRTSHKYFNEILSCTITAYN